MHAVQLPPVNHLIEPRSRISCWKAKRCERSAHHLGALQVFVQCKFFLGEPIYERSEANIVFFRLKSRPP